MDDILYKSCIIKKHESVQEEVEKRLKEKRDRRLAEKDEENVQESSYSSKDEETNEPNRKNDKCNDDLKIKKG